MSATLDKAASLHRLGSRVGDLLAQNKVNRLHSTGGYAGRDSGALMRGCGVNILHEMRNPTIVELDRLRV